MTLGSIIGIVLLVLAILVVIMFPGEVKVLFKGFVRVFIRDMATTPEGAQAIYAEKIDQAQEAYSKADDALKRAAGKLENANRDMDTYKKRLKKIESECEALVKADNFDAAQLKAEEREEILADIERCSEIIKGLEVATNEAKEIQEMCEKNLRKLKKEAKDVVENMKVKSQLKEVYDDLDELKASTTTDKLLESVRDKSKELNEIAAGSRVVHENRISTRVQKATTEAHKAQSNDYIESLRKKHNK